ncbi:response regulator [Butyrivibrio sp. YAB3001]|uniref:response regulator n=1 Tax=Butyrivibrio sp. YAB3001 TaxID=1520812 RepID=UPI0008F64E2E|nr:response regulator [Butyrivibrio sp. YAB3001]SFD05506.1 Hpt domain-containing protein [Butyrivibrio sp. YAB3001]
MQIDREAAYLEELKSVDGISVSEGLYYCGNQKALLKFLTTFYKNIDGKAQEIQEAYEKEDIGFFTIKVHALKSTARMIGASKLTDLALRLEEAGHADDLDFIRNNTDELLELYKSYKERLAFLDEVKQIPVEPAPKDSSDKKVILVIDDDASYLTIVREWLNDDYRLFMSSSGLRGIKWLENNKPDLILLDYEMPDTSGEDILKMLRDNPATKRLPVFILSGKDDIESRDRILTLDIQGFIHKASGRDNIVGVINEFFEE